MDEGQTHIRLWCFGAVEFDDVLGRLTVAGDVVDLDRNSRAVLATLLRAAPEPCSKEALLEAGWPGRVVHENSLAKAVGRLRKALGADGESIEAVYGSGYRLAVEPAVAAAPAGEVSSRGRRILPLAAAALGLAGIALALGFSGALREDKGPPLVIGEAPDVLGRVLWVDDHPENNVNEKRFLEGKRVAVYNVPASEDALMLLSMYDYHAVISDMGCGDEPLAGLKLVEEMRAREDNTPFILYTILPSDEQRELLERHGGQGVAVTPEELYEFILPLFEQDSPAR